MVRYRDHAGKQRAEQFIRKTDAMARLREVESAEQTGRLDALDAGKQTLAAVGRAVRETGEVELVRANRLDENGVHLECGRSRPGGGRATRERALADMPVRTIRKSHVTPSARTRSRQGFLRQASAVR